MQRAEQKAALIQRGIADYKAGKYDSADEFFRRVLISDPNSGDAHHLLGVIAMERKRREMTFEHLLRAIELNPDAPAYQNSLGVAYVRDGQFAAGIHHFWQAIAGQPDYFDAMKNLLIALQDIGQFQEVIRVSNRALKLNPESGEVIFQRARALHSLDRLDDAMEGYEKALEYLPNHVPSLTEIGFGWLDRDEPEKALPFFERSIELGPTNVRGLDGLGHVYELQGNTDKAITTWERAVELNSDAPPILTSLGVTCVQVGRIDEGRKRLERVLEISPQNAEAFLALSQSAKIQEGDPLIVKLESLITRYTIPPEARSKMHFALGKAYEDTGRFEEAFDQYKRGNQLKRQLIHHEAEQLRVQINSLMTYFTDERFKSYDSRFADDSTIPIFVVGMPRSGTTLVEQIIASHPEVHGAGELPFVERMVRRMPAGVKPKTAFPQCLDVLSPEAGKKLATEHISRLHYMAPEVQHVVDKMPKNLVHVGLIRLLWPNAKIVHCVRDYRDIAMSCFFRYFARGQPFSWDLSELGDYCRHHAKLCKHWHRVLGTKIYPSHYEELTGNQEQKTRELIEYLELPWSDSCLQFHQTDRRIKTNPLQVRKPIYQTSVAKWKKYEPWIGDFLEALGSEHDLSHL